jgi:hypothetical protein
MTLTWKDGLATALTALAVLVLVAAVESWDVWLVGSSHRWAAGVILVLGLVTCTLGSADRDLSTGRPDTTTKLLSAVGVAALVFAVWALVTGSLTPLALLVASVVVLWAASTVRHAWHPTHRPIVT